MTKNLQEWFEKNHPKDVKQLIIVINEVVEGSELFIENYPNLRYISTIQCPQIKKLKINNCPNLDTFEFNQTAQQVKVQPKQCICWTGYFSLGFSIVIFSYLLYRKYSKKEKINGKQKEKKR